MNESHADHRFAPGDAVLATVRGAQIPGVITDVQGERILVQVSQPWTDETGQPTDTLALTPKDLSPAIDQSAGGTPELSG